MFQRIVFGTILVLVAALGVGIGALYSFALADSQPVETCVVGKIVDGDTIICHYTAIDGVRLSKYGTRQVRLIAYNAPEDSLSYSECYGSNATAALKAKLPIGTTVRLERGALVGDRDVNGRYLRFVSVNGSEIGQELLREGLGKWMQQYDEPTYADPYRLSHKTAKQLHLGIWAC